MLFIHYIYWNCTDYPIYFISNPCHLYAVASVVLVKVCGVFIFNTFWLFFLYIPYTLYKEWRQTSDVRRYNMVLTVFMIQRIKMEPTIQKLLNFFNVLSQIFLLLAIPYEISCMFFLTLNVSEIKKRKKRRSNGDKTNLKLKLFCMQLTFYILFFFDSFEEVFSWVFQLIRCIFSNFK